MSTDRTTRHSDATRTSLELPPKHTFTVADVAEFLGVNHKTVRDRINAGHIRVTRLGRVIRIPRSEVLKLLGD